MQFYWATSAITVLVTTSVFFHPKVRILFVKKDKRDYAIKTRIVKDVPFFKKRS